MQRGADKRWHGVVAGPRLRIDGQMITTDVGVSVTQAPQGEALQIAVGTWAAEVALHHTSGYAPVQMRPAQASICAAQPALLCGRWNRPTSTWNP